MKLAGWLKARCARTWVTLLPEDGGRRALGPLIIPQSGLVGLS